MVLGDLSDKSVQVGQIHFGADEIVNLRRLIVLDSLHMLLLV